MSARCPVCRGGTSRRHATPAAPFLHRAGGLVPVLLSGVRVETCPGCRTEKASLPRPRALRAAVAAALARRPHRLSGPEIRFLRSRAGIPAGRFAQLLGIDPAHLSRVENGKLPGLGAPADRLARLVAAGKGGRRGTIRLLDGLDAGGADGPPPPLRLAWTRERSWRARP